MRKRFDLSRLKAKESLENRRRIYLRMQANPFLNQRGIGAELNLSPGTVSRHVKAIKNGWKPGGENGK